MSSEYEEILIQLRPFGPFQIRVFVLVSMLETPLAWAMLLPIFTAAQPKWICADLTVSNVDASVLGTDPSPTSFNGSVEEPNNTQSCYDSGWACPQLKFTDEFTSLVSEWNLVCDKDYIPDLITSLQMVGVLVGAVITGQLADVFGRRKLLFLEYSLLLIVWFGSAFADSWQLYAGLRFVIGALVGGTLVVNFVLPLEFVTPAWRTFCGCVGFWAVGLMTLALWAFFVRDWRHLTIATSVSSAFILISWWFVPESPRWLLSRGRVKEAQDILTKMAHYNKRPVPDFSGLKLFIEKEEKRRLEQRKYSYWHLFSSWKMAKATLILMYGWFVSSSVYYGLNFNAKNLYGDRYLNVFLSGLAEIPALIYVVVFNNLLGRRVTTTSLMLTAGIFCFSILFLDIAGKLEELSGLTLALALIGKAGISGGWAAVQILSAETFPTVVRNIGVGACSMSARIGGIVAPQFVYLGEHYKPVPFTVFGVVAIICGLLMLLMNETVGVPLPDQLHGSSSQHTQEDQQSDCPSENAELTAVDMTAPTS